MMKRKTIAAMATGVALVLTMMGATSASASCNAGSNKICGWDNTDYWGSQYIDSTFTGTTRLDVTDNVVSSVKNRRTAGDYYACSAYAVEAWAMIYKFNAASNYVNLGGNNDQLDHLYYNANRC
ncbi:MAG: hypothetical protein ACOH1T_08010 [Microbacteriaceae bacterium]